MITNNKITKIYFHVDEFYTNFYAVLKTGSIVWDSNRDSLPCDNFFPVEITPYGNNEKNDCQ